MRRYGIRLKGLYKLIMAKRQQLLESFFITKETKKLKAACEAVETPAAGKTNSNQPKIKEACEEVETPAVETISNRQIKGSWFTDFDWLSLEDGKFFCKVCRKRKKQNIFAKEGKDSAKPKRDDLKKHNSSVDHREAVEESRVLKPAMEKATVNAYSHAKDALIAEMRTC